MVRRNREIKIILTAVLAAVILLFFLLPAVLPSRGIRAAGPLVVDQSGVFTSGQVSQLEQAAAELGGRYAMDIVIVTTDDAGGKSAQAYADDFFDYGGYGVGDEFDGVLFLMDFDNGEIQISTSGSGIRYLTDDRIDSILDDVLAPMQAGDYYGAAQSFLDATAAFMAAGIPSDQYNEPESGGNALTWFEGILGALASGGMGLSIFAGTRKSYRGHPRRAVFDYQKNSLVDLAVASDADNLVNSFVTTRRIPRATTTRPGSSGRSSTHTSGSGRTHGGGGRRF
ncbi:MAG TPA: TPM domain-containing protein [Clostridiales bacterium]|nr:TPM domain-containing protein [Clostridiales bacterium]